MSKTNKKFWSFAFKNKEVNSLSKEELEKEDRILTLNGVIAEESWFDDDITPRLFKEELNSGSGNITVWINSPGGDCIAAAQIYNLLKDYKGKITIKIDGLAASAASVIAMAGDEVLMSPVSMLMIHNPQTLCMGDHYDMEKTINMLEEVKESIINAYQLKTGKSRNKLSELMDNETWMNANAAIDMGFADGLIVRNYKAKEEEKDDEDLEENDNEELDKEDKEDKKEEKNQDTKNKLKANNETGSFLFGANSFKRSLTDKIMTYEKEKPQMGEILQNTEGKKALKNAKERLEIIGKFI